VTVRVLLADDQELLRAGLRMVLRPQSDLELVGEASDGEEAVALARRLRPDVAVMDIRMPRVDGIEATRRLLASPDGGPRVLVLTTFGEDEYLRAALRAGASGFLLKDAPAEEIIEAIRVVARGDALLDTAVTRRVIEGFVDHDAGAAVTDEGLERLTPRELEILRLVARGLSNAEIAATLVVSEATVKTHVGRVLMKLDLRDRVQAVVLAYQTGLVRAP
jgi:DNA-binding NarL/FixJ family response regulator